MARSRRLSAADPTEEGGCEGLRLASQGSLAGKACSRPHGEGQAERSQAERSQVERSQAERSPGRSEAAKSVEKGRLKRISRRPWRATALSLIGARKLSAEPSRR